MLDILSPFTAFQVGDSIHFSCTVPSGPKVLNFHLYKKGVETPLVTQRADNGKRRMELTLTDVEVTHQGSYSCVNSNRLSSQISQPMYHSNSIDIDVGKCQSVCNMCSCSGMGLYACRECRLVMPSSS